MKLTKAQRMVLTCLDAGFSLRGDLDSWWLHNDCNESFDRGMAISVRYATVIHLLQAGLIGRARARSEREGREYYVISVAGRAAMDTPERTTR